MLDVAVMQVDGVTTVEGPTVLDGLETVEMEDAEEAHGIFSARIATQSSCL